jgi:hypothetical protein
VCENRKTVLISGVGGGWDIRHGDAHASPPVFDVPMQDPANLPCLMEVKFD